MAKENTTQAIANPSNRQRGLFGIFAKRRPTSPDGSSESDDVDEEKNIKTTTSLKDEEIKSISFLQLFRFSTKHELSLNAVGLFAAVCAGAAQPLMSLIFGNLTQTFVDYQTALSGGNAEALASAQANFMHTASLDACWLVLIGGVISICSWLYMYIWNYTGESTAKRIRELYFKAVIRQDIAYFDNIGAGEITAHIETDTHLVQQGISEKCALVVSNVSCFVAGFVIAYVRSWRLALVMTTVVPCITITGLIMTTFISRFNKHSLNHVSEGSSIAEEVISSIRTSHAFGTQHILSALYEAPINVAHKLDLKSANTNGFGIATFLFIVYCMYSLAFYFGTTLVIDGIGGVGVILNVIFAILLGSFTLSQVGAEIQPILNGRAAAAKIFATIERVPEIDSQSSEGMKPSFVEGELRLENVSFDYPSRMNVPILRKLSLHFPAGKTAALVGASGSGKSTVIQLVERFYDPLDGRVTLDGVDIRDLNLKWLRSQISLVSQEPVLFKTTIAGNVEHGLVGTPYEHAPWEEKMRLIKEACVKANADLFISRLPQGYETLVGERGFLLSGGQKQRIAIARAIVSDPKILLLDEATSALDTQSEGVVQDALDKAAAGRTTITIAHRLSTIKNADKIYVMGQGRVLEQGTHEELLNSEGAYSKLVQAQKVRDLSRRVETDDPSTLVTDEAASEDNDDVLVKKKVEEHSESVVDINDSSRRSMSRSLLDVSTSKENEQDEGGIFRLFILFFTLDKSLIKQYALGSIFAILQGMVYPAYGIVMGKAIIDFSSTDPTELRFQGSRNALWFFVIALCSMCVVCCEHLSMGRASANVTRLLRSHQFKAMLRQDIRYFDEDQNSTGALVSKLSDNPQKVNGLVGTTLGTIIQGISTVITGLIIGLIFNWRLALVAMACEPFILTVGYIRLQAVVMKDQHNRKAHEDSAHFACEAASSIRTVASLTREDSCIAAYSKSLEEPLKRSLITALWSNLLYALSNSSIFFVTALAFWYGAKEIVSGDLSTMAFFIVTFSVIFGASEAGAIWQFAPDISSAGQAARDINKLLSIVPEIDAESSEGLVPANVRGEVRLEDVHFRYPTRFSVKVLRGLDLEIKPGTYVALVGASGCGKSTVIQLMERFYDPTSGRVLLDGQDISQLNVQEYRKNIALVSQEPTLYAGSIKFNILLGATKPAEEVTQEELEAVCRDANILEFITSLPNGFDTEVGGKGSQLSGGQKQRIAIARALIRNPKVLLLDEATSALDSNSEKVVQAALDQASKGRTTIAIAHRLSTIQNADKIYFIKDGRVSECGTHDELLRLQGGYYEYVQLQALSKN